MDDRVITILASVPTGNTIVDHSIVLYIACRRCFDNKNMRHALSSNILLLIHSKTIWSYRMSDTLSARHFTLNMISGRWSELRHSFKAAFPL